MDKNQIKNYLDGIIKNSNDGEIIKFGDLKISVDWWKPGVYNRMKVTVMHNYDMWIFWAELGNKKRTYGNMLDKISECVYVEAADAVVMA